jgi:hypothetical protein
MTGRLDSQGRASTAANPASLIVPVPIGQWRSRPVPTVVGVNQVDPDQDAALRRLRAAFGFVDVLDVINHEPGPGDELPSNVQPRGEDSGGSGVQLAGLTSPMLARARAVQKGEMPPRQPAPTAAHRWPARARLRRPAG